MVKCYICPINEECTLYTKWLKEGQEVVQKMNSHYNGEITMQFDSEAIPDWYGECPLLRFLR